MADGIAKAGTRLGGMECRFPIGNAAWQIAVVFRDFGSRMAIGDAAAQIEMPRRRLRCRAAT